MSTPEIVLVSIVGYILGSVSFAVLIAKSRGVDIFQEGSGNPGATNVKRVLGSKAGHTVFALDALKGLVAAGWPYLILGEFRLGVIGLVASILGHSFSIFLKFKGGKGVATTMGGLAALMPVILAIGLVAWASVFFTTRLVALASILFAFSLPMSAFYLYGQSDPRFTVSLLLSVLIVFRHRSNVRRMLQGKENSFKKK